VLRRVDIVKILQLPPQKLFERLLVEVFGMAEARDVRCVGRVPRSSLCRERHEVRMQLAGGLARAESFVHVKSVRTSPHCRARAKTWKGRREDEIAQRACASSSAVANRDGSAVLSDITAEL
jgi:hypothetical protein